MSSFLDGYSVSSVVVSQANDVVSMPLGQCPDSAKAGQIALGLYAVVVLVLRTIESQRSLVDYNYLLHQSRAGKLNDLYQTAPA